MSKTVGINVFVKRQISPGAEGFGGTIVSEDEMGLLCDAAQEHVRKGTAKEGYAPFVLIATILPEDLGIEAILCPIAVVTEENVELVQSALEARRDGEPEFMEFWLPRDSVERLAARHVDLVLYTREQLEKEGEPHTSSDYDLISVNAEVGDDTPMGPNTIERNAMGPDAGGSGVPLDADTMAAAKAFWVSAYDTPETLVGKHVMTRPVSP